MGQAVGHCRTTLEAHGRPGFKSWVDLNMLGVPVNTYDPSGLKAKLGRLCISLFASVLYKIR